MNNRKKSLTIVLVLLCTSVAVAPSISLTAVKASADTDRIEMTAQVCGVNGFENTSVTLTSDQYQRLEQYLVGFRARLNQTTSPEDTIPLFKEAVVELHTYGLLPRGMTVERAQRLVTGSPVNSQRLRTLSFEHPVLINEVNNRFCLIAGNTDNTFIFGPIKSSLFVLLMIITYANYDIATMLDNHGLHRLANLFYAVDTLLEWLWMPTRVIPFEIVGLVTMGSYYYEWEVGPHYYPSDGWISAVGSEGKQSINGSFYGNLKTGFLGLFYGMSGFTGIVLHPATKDRAIFLGTAFRAAMSTTPPYAMRNG